jgi:hypothetical protein
MHAFAALRVIEFNIELLVVEKTMTLERSSW